MSRTIEIEVGELYANMHEQYLDELDEQYVQRVRQQTEDFIHNFNQQVERQQEQVAQGELDLDEEQEAALDGE